MRPAITTCGSRVLGTTYISAAEGHVRLMHRLGWNSSITNSLEDWEL